MSDGCLEGKQAHRSRVGSRVCVPSRGKWQSNFDEAINSPSVEKTSISQSVFADFQDTQHCAEGKSVEAAVDVHFLKMPKFLGLKLN